MATRCGQVALALWVAGAVGAMSTTTHAQPAPSSALPPAPAAPPGATAPLWGAPAAPGWPAPYAGIPIQLESTEPGVEISLYHPDAKIGVDAPIVSCPGPCGFNLIPGRYKVWVKETANTLSGSRMLELTQPTRLTMDPDMTEHRSAGLALGISGPIVAVLGAVVFLTNVCFEGCDGSSSDSRESLAGAGILAMLGGIAITPVGWVMFGTSYKPEYEMQPLVRRGSGGGSSRMVVGRERPPMGLRWTVRF